MPGFRRDLIVKANCAFCKQGKFQSKLGEYYEADPHLKDVANAKRRNGMPAFAYGVLEFEDSTIQMGALHKALLLKARTDPPRRNSREIKVRQKIVHICSVVDRLTWPLLSETLLLANTWNRDRPSQLLL